LRDVRVRFEQDVFPWIGKRPIAQVSAPVLLEVLRRVERRDAIDRRFGPHSARLSSMDVS